MKHLVLVLSLLMSPLASAERLAPPPVPFGLEPDAGSKLFLVGHAEGTQNYVCLPSTTATSGFAWTLFTPEATLYTHGDRQLTTHFFSPDPLEPAAFRPTWQHSRDTSRVWAKLNTPSSDSRFVEAGAIPWLLLDVTATQAGPRGRGALTRTTQIQRLNTSGGAAPATGCAGWDDVGKKQIVPYLADYFFYANPDREE
jgi:hypothetical protein